MSAKETAKRYALFIISLFFNAMGVSLAAKAELGVSPLASVAYVMSINFTKISLGSWMFLWNCLLIALQVILLRKKFKPVQLLQIPLSLLFGYFTDLTLKMIDGIAVGSYFGQIIMLLIGIIVLGFGIALSVIANVIMNSGEAFVKVVSDLSGRNFSVLKTVFDITYVVAAIILSLLLSGGISGIREGTLISALLTGLAVNIFMKLLHKPIDTALKA